MAVGHHNMSPSVFLLWLVVGIFIVAHYALAADQLGLLLNCGSSEGATVGSLKYIGDGNYIKEGKTAILNSSDLLPTLLSVRYFPDKSARKYCYTIPVIKSRKYLVRTTFYYGNYDGLNKPPVFDQIIDGTKWNIVNTTSDYAKGLSSYYEVVVKAMGKSLPVCFAKNAQAGGNNPFISALEVLILDDSLYNPTDFGKYALVTVARHSFGDQELISYPDDKFNRVWQPFVDGNPAVESQSNITSIDFWNVPPVKAFRKGLAAGKGQKLELQWPPVLLPNTGYYIALYFQDERTPGPDSWRVFDVAINGINFYTKLNATTKGVTIYAQQWPLSGQTKITLTPADDNPVGPVISAGEVFQIMPLAGRTLTRDAIAMGVLAKSFRNPPADWTGDPCLPVENSWSGVTCSKENLARVVSVELTNVGLSGSLPASIGKLTALRNLWLAGNNITGTIPDMCALKELETLHLENNQLEGSIPESLGTLPKLRELLLQNNKLDRTLPAALQNRNGVTV